MTNYKAVINAAADFNKIDYRDEISFKAGGKIIERMDLDIRLFDCIEATLLDVEKLNIITEQIKPESQALYPFNQQ